jgi:hypothetical protein
VEGRASRIAARAGLIALMVFGALMLWVGNPAIWLWIGSQMTESQQGEFGPYAVVAIGILASTIAVSFALARVNRAYEEVVGHRQMVRMRLPWLRSLRDERDPSSRALTVLDFILVATAIAAIASFAFWMLFLAGSPLPGA